MPQTLAPLDAISIDARSHKILRIILKENPELREILRTSKTELEALVGVRNWVQGRLKDRPHVLAYANRDDGNSPDFVNLEWRDYAAIRILDYVENAGRGFKDLNLRGEIAVTNPIKLLWLAVNRGTGGAKPFFFEDMLELLRQLSSTAPSPAPGREKVEEWMERTPSGLDPRIVELREENRARIIDVVIERIDAGKIRDTLFTFPPDSSVERKRELVLEWWNDPKFHLKFSVRSAEDLNEFLGRSLDPDTMKVLQAAEEAGIPFFINPYYLSLLFVRVPWFAVGADLAIRQYVLYSRQLVEEFGHIVGWEKEDQVKPGEPNAAGWILPSDHNIHRRYPEVAILIPDTMGRACGGLCASCQRMYDFQRGNLNFNLDKLRPGETWPEKLRRLVDYYETDSQLRDVLITGGDALMSTDASLRTILEAVLGMIDRKKKANETRPDGEKFAEILRVRLGTRLPVYLPQRITTALADLLADFREKAAQLGVKQFLVQTHFESPLEMTPEALEGIRRLRNAGWTVTNQHVYTAAASRRGHAAKLRRVMTDAGILPYYTFSVKGYMENWRNFAPQARIIQERIEEKTHGTIPPEAIEEIKTLPAHPSEAEELLGKVREENGLPFLASDRSVLNLPGVGKSQTFRVIGITRYGRRILEFDHDATRRHSPVIHSMGRVVIIESKSIREYLNQMEDLGEETSDYRGIFGYSMGETEQRLPVYEYPEYPFRITDEMTHFEMPKD